LLDKFLKQTVYSQYAQFESAARQMGEAPPQGSAWQELRDMVGLGEA